MQSRTRFRNFSWIALGLTLAVILGGGFVRATGSGAGCGSHWPLCNGEVVPLSGNVKTLIEYSHRITSGVVMVLSVIQFVWARRIFARGHRTRRAAAFSLFFMMTEALVGAGLVIFEYVADDASFARAIWMGAHLLNTFLLVGAMTITAHWAQHDKPLRMRERSGTSLALAIAYLSLLAVGMTGAIAALGDTLFPAKSLAEGLAHDFSPTAHFLVRLRVLHPLLALGSAAYLLVIAHLFAQRGKVMRRSAQLLQGSVLVQVAAGFVNLLLLAPISMQMVHLLLADLVWIALVLFGLTALESEDPALATDAAVAKAVS